MPHATGVGEYGVLNTGPKNYRLSNAEYCAEHGLVLQGEQPLPEAYQTFESVGFPHDIMDEVCPLPSGGCAWACPGRCQTSRPAPEPLESKIPKTGCSGALHFGAPSNAARMAVYG